MLDIGNLFLLKGKGVVKKQEPPFSVYSAKKSDEKFSCQNLRNPVDFSKKLYIITYEQ